MLFRDFVSFTVLLYSKRIRGYLAVYVAVVYYVYSQIYRIEHRLVACHIFTSKVVCGSVSRGGTYKT